MNNSNMPENNSNFRVFTKKRLYTTTSGSNVTSEYCFTVHCIHVHHLPLGCRESATGVFIIHFVMPYNRMAHMHKCTSRNTFWCSLGVDDGHHKWRLMNICGSNNKAMPLRQLLCPCGALQGNLCENPKIWIVFRHIWIVSPLFPYK